MKSNLIFLVLSVFGTCTAFCPRPQARPASTRLYLEDWVAEMIDRELYREQHKKEFENAWMKKNRGAIMYHMNQGAPSSMLTDDELDTSRQIAKDRKMAHDDPQKYCADRCVATGNCDVYEDFFHLSPQEVLEFCNDCVLNEDDGAECDIPDTFYDLDKLKP